MIFRSAAVAIMPILLVCLAIIPSVQAQASGITSIRDLKYPSQAVLQNGLAQVAITFTVYYNYYYNPQGYLVFGIYDPDSLDYVEGTAMATPIPCQSLAGTQFANAAVCVVVPASGSGTESASFTLTFNSPQQYTLSVVTLVWDSKNLLSGSEVPGSTNKADFAITVTGQALTSTGSATTSSATAASTQPPSQVPTTGSWWTLKGTWSRSSTGSGSWKGTLAETGEYTTKITVTGMTSDTITLSRQDDDQWTCAPTDTWTCSASSGTESHTYQYTMSLNTFKVIAVGGETSSNLIGHATYIMINVGQLTEGGKVTQYWWVPDSDGKADSIVDADFTVGMQTAIVKGVQLKAWRLSYSGDVIGWYYNNDGVYSKGPATETALYDPVYGIEVTYSIRSNTNGAEVGGAGTWTEAYSDDYQLEDTSLNFTSTAASTQTSTAHTSSATFSTPVTTSGQTTTTRTSSADSTWLYVIAGLVAIVIVLFVLVMRRRGGAASQPSQRASAAVTGPSTARVGEKFCISCGSRISSTVKFCPRCGAKQS
jgi:hypothetical protein